LEALEAEKLERAARASERAAAALKEIEGQSAATKMSSAQSQSSSSGAMDIAAKIMSKMGFRPGQSTLHFGDDTQCRGWHEV
jgi:hypothetical protein